MKRLGVLLVVLGLLLVATTGAMARSTITINPLGFSYGVFSVEYETEMGRGPTTLGVPVMYWSAEGTDYELTAMGLGAGVRYYFDGRAHDGFYVGGYGSWARLNGSSDGTDFTGNAFGLSGVAGYKFLVGDGFVIDVGAGVGFPISTTVSSGGVSDSQVGGVFGTSFSLALGLAF